MTVTGRDMLSRMQRGAARFLPLRGLLLSCLLGMAGPALGNSATALTPLFSNIEGGRSQTFSVRFTDNAGAPVVNAAVQFRNDVCGYFPNGSFAIQVLTDANGVASTVFTASPPGGITCWLTAGGAGASVRFDVLTYGVHQVDIATVLTPPEPRPGQTYELEVSLRMWDYRLQHVNIGARIVAGAGTAQLSSGIANTEETGRARFVVLPQGQLGDYDIEVNFRGRTKRLRVHGTYQGSWWGGPLQNGWGLSVTQHGNGLVAGWYYYGVDGRPTWTILPGCAWNANFTACTGVLYNATGAWLGDYDPARFIQTPVGSATLSFTDAKNGSWAYSVNGVTGSVPITRMQFGLGTAPGGVDYSDVWWGGTAQNGWGVALQQQQGVLVGAWYTYDAAGQPTWLLMNGGSWQGPTVYEGILNRASGAPMLGMSYQAAMMSSQPVGTVTLTFLDANHAEMRYAVDGVTQTRNLVRQPF